MDKPLTHLERILQVPYFAQYRDVAQVEHAVGACGMTDVYMVLNYFKIVCPSLDELIEKGMQEGGYGASGWKHDYFVSLFRSFGFGKALRMERMSDTQIELIRGSIAEGDPVIVSIAREFWGRQDFHMVLIVGTRESVAGALEGFYYHDPAGTKRTPADNRFVPIELFPKHWRRMAIFPGHPG